MSLRLCILLQFTCTEGEKNNMPHSRNNNQPITGIKRIHYANISSVMSLSLSAYISTELMFPESETAIPVSTPVETDKNQITEKPLLSPRNGSS